jgi:hypothetical protein
MFIAVFLIGGNSPSHNAQVLMILGSMTHPKVFFTLIQADRMYMQYSPSVNEVHPEASQHSWMFIGGVSMRLR